MTTVYTNNTGLVGYIRYDDAQIQIKAAQIAILRELLESGPKMESCVPGAIQEAAAQSANHMRNKWRDHITAKIKELQSGD